MGGTSREIKMAEPVSSGVGVTTVIQVYGMRLLMAYCSLNVLSSG